MRRIEDWVEQKLKHHTSARVGEKEMISDISWNRFMLFCNIILVPLAAGVLGWALCVSPN